MLLLFLFLVISSVPFRPVLTCPEIGHLVFSSVSVLFQSILSNARLDRSKLDKFSSIQFSSTQQNSAKLSLAQFQLNSAQFSTIQLNSAQFSPTQLNSAQLSSAPVPFGLVLTCLISHWTAGIFVCFRFIPNNSVQLDRSKLDQKGPKVVKSPTSLIQLNSEFMLVISPVPFCPVLTYPISHWTAGIFVCFHFSPNNSVQC